MMNGTCQALRKGPGFYLYMARLGFPMKANDFTSKWIKWLKRAASQR
jgi:hypothetical protein